MEIYNGRYCVYVHINKINNKLYFGQTCQSVEERWRSDGSGYRPSIGNRITRFWAAIQKYGWDNFEHFVIASNLTADEANRFEELLIEKFNTTNHIYGYNMQSGGKSHSPTQETREKIRNTLIGKLTGEKNPRYGVRLSNETKEKISKNHADVSGVKNPAAKPVVCLDTKTVYGASTIAAEMTNTNAMGICNCCYGRAETAGGYRWRLLYDISKKDSTIIPGAITLGLITEEEALAQLNTQQNN